MTRTLLAYAARKQLLMSLDDPRHGRPRPSHNRNRTPVVPTLSQTADLRSAPRAAAPARPQGGLSHG